MNVDVEAVFKYAQGDDGSVVLMAILERKEKFPCGREVWILARREL